MKKFGTFEVDLRARELRKGGIRIRLQDQPFEILAMMLERPGDVVTREELSRRLWPAGTFVDFEHSLNAAVKRLRAALGDEADNPRFVETLHRRGYRFIAPVASSEKDNGAHRSTSGPGPARPHADGLTARLVVLPFANLSGDPEQEFFSDGLTEEIINALAHVQGLKVIARTSAFAFKGQHVDVRRIAESLGVTNVLEGSVRRGGNRIRVTAQLIKVDDGFHLWSERFDRDLADVFAVQDEIAAAIAIALQGHLLESSGRVYTPSVEAYEAYLMARHYQSHLTQASLEQGRICYERAIRLDPRYALPHTGLAELYHILSTGMGADQQYRAMVRASAERGLALDPDLPEGHAWLGTLAAGYDRDWPEAERQYRMAVAGDPRLRHWYAHFCLRFVGRAAEAVAEHEAALRSDPLSHITRVGYVLSLMSAGRRDDAARESRRLIEFNPDFAGTYALLAFDIPNAGLAEALAFAERAHALTSWKTTGPTGVLAGLLARAGDHARSDALVRELGDPQEYGRPIGHALYHLARGDADRAIDFVGLALGQRHPLAMIVLVGGPYGAELRASSRWPSLAAQFNLP
jgi:TolB-like protein/Tfp pilus assembly protein PilF